MWYSIPINKKERELYRMKQSEIRDDHVRKLLLKNKIATMDELKIAAGTNATMTVHRCLSRLGYMTSYSHRGRFYTLQSIPRFNSQGVWAYHEIKFSRHGNLLETAAALISQSDAGFTCFELEGRLQIELKHALLNLHRRGVLARIKHGGSFVYMSADKGERLRQDLTRRKNDASETGVESTRFMPDELRAGIILFFSLLDEKQRRLYAGMEAAKLGHGGDRKIAGLLGLDSHTVAKGRLELFGGSVERGCVRNAGAGRKPVEKKLPE